MNELEQAQTIAEIRAEAKEKREHYKAWNLDTRQSDEVFDLLHRSITVVDSQAQKIADLNRVGSNTLLALIESQEKIAEQANEIERLKAANDMAEKARINSSLNEYYRKSL